MELEVGVLGEEKDEALADGASGAENTYIQSVLCRQEVDAKGRRRCCLEGPGTDL